MAAKEMIGTPCSNCGTVIPQTQQGRKQMVAAVRTLPGALCVAMICEDCMKGVLTMKLVFKRDSADEGFQFEQYLPVACEKT